MPFRNKLNPRPHPIPNPPPWYENNASGFTFLLTSPSFPHVPSGEGKNLERVLDL